MGIRQFALIGCASATLLLSSCGGGGGGGGDTTTPPPTVTPLSVTTTTLPGGQVGVAYSQTLTASGGTTPYTWAVSSGTLPAGLSLAQSTGVVSGTPTAAVSGTALTFTVTDSSSPTQSKSTSVSLTIAAAAAPLAISTTSLPNGTVGTAYSMSLAATGGTTPYSWSVTGGTLPGGLSLAKSSGAISGTPTAAVNSTTVTFTVTDSATPAHTTSTTLALTVLAQFSITTTTLPNGQISSAYSATLAANGGTAPITWSLTSGTLPAGLTLSGNQITGTPTATAAQTPLTFEATDSSNPAQSAQPVTLTLNVSPAVINVAVSQARAALTTTQKLVLSATTDDNAGVTWSVTPSGGSFSPSTTANGANVTFTAPSTAGTYTVTATSVTESSQSAALTVAVTDLAGVYSYHNDLARDGVNAQEYALTTSTVNTGSFGKLFSCTVDGAVYAQPLWVANLTVGGAVHNVVFVATEHDSLYAFDADTSPCVTLWSASLIDTNHGGNAGETSVASGKTGNQVGSGIGDMQPEVGITGTPAIDPSTNTLYVVSKSVNSGGTTFYQRLHAIDMTTGNEKSSGSPVTITGSAPGTGDGGSTVAFNSQQENQRAGLTLVNGTVYIIWASHEDTPPYYGWVMGYAYNGSQFTQTQILNVSANVGYGGIWMSGSAPAADSSGNLYMITGNGVFDVNSGGSDYGDSYLKIPTSSGSFTVSDYFTPSDQASDNTGDGDFGAGGAAVLVDLPSGAPVQHLAIGGGKDTNLYVLNRDNMGHLGDSNAWQELGQASGIFATPALWNNQLYLAAEGGPLVTYALNPSTALFGANPTSTATAPGTFGFPGSTPSVSASGTTNGIIWALNNGRSCIGKASSCGPTVLFAYDATNLGKELWDSTMVGSDAAGYAVKFNVPTIANGKVYIGTRGNNMGLPYGSTSVNGELDVYGLKPN
jgi:hypothetical protein